MLKHNDFITNLDLRSNDIGIEGGVALFDAIRLNTTVTQVSLLVKHSTRFVSTPPSQMQPQDHRHATESHK